MRKVALVIGSSIGLGASTACELASEGYDIVITYLSHKEEALNLEAMIKKEYKVDTLTIKCDITNEEDLKNVLNEIKSKFNRLDVLVNNAGISIDNDFNLKTKEEFACVVNTNLIGPFLSSRIFGNYMMENGSGVIINVSSNNGIDDYYIESIDYDASKAGLINLSHNLAKYFEGTIRVNTVCPGWIDTPMNNSLSEEFKNKVKEKIIMKRFASPNEVANLICFLSSDKASYINDAVIRIDGGKR